MPLALDLNGGGELSSATHLGVSFTGVSSDMSLVCCSCS